MSIPRIKGNQRDHLRACLASIRLLGKCNSVGTCRERRRVEGGSVGTTQCFIAPYWKLCMPCQGNCTVLETIDCGHHVVGGVLVFLSVGGPKIRSWTSQL